MGSGERKMSRRMEDLEPDFRETCSQVIKACTEKGVDMRPFFTARHPVEQGALWRQSRSSSEVKSVIHHLQENGAKYLAQCIVDAGPQSGRWATNAIPGMSWHQWGLAIDCYWLVDGRAEWGAQAVHDGINGYKVYEQTAESFGLRSLASMGDAVHIQKPQESSPKSLSLVEIDQAMRERWR